MYVSCTVLLTLNLNVVCIQAKVKEQIRKVSGDLTKWDELSPDVRLRIFRELKEHGPGIVRALNTALVILTWMMKDLLTLLKMQPSQFFSPLGTCLEMECQGKKEQRFQELETVQEKFLDYYVQRRTYCSALMKLYQHAGTSHIYKNQDALSKVSVG